MASLLNVAVGTAVLLSAIFAIYGYVQAFRALRAKRRASDALRTYAKLKFKHELLSRKSAATSEELRELIESHIKTLSESDQQFIHQGLWQSSNTGSERFAREVLTRATAQM